MKRKSKKKLNEYMQPGSNKLLLLIFFILIGMLVLFYLIDPSRNAPISISLTACWINPCDLNLAGDFIKHLIKTVL